MKNQTKQLKLTSILLSLVFMLTLLPTAAPFSKAQNNTVAPTPFWNEIPRFAAAVAGGMDVTVEEQPLELASVRVNNSRTNNGTVVAPTTRSAVGMLDFDKTEGAITVEIDNPGVTSAVVRPTRSGIDVSVESGVITFQISDYGQYSVEFNNAPQTNPLVLFVNPIEEIPGGARIITGKVNDLTVAANETVYLAPGSAVYGSVRMNGDGGKLFGRGVITGHDNPSGELGTRNLAMAVIPINMDNRKDITINGIAILDPNRWAMQVRRSTNVSIENVKIITARNNGDGISIQNSRDVFINKCFIRSWDDNIVVKNYFDTAQNPGNIFATNCVLWTDLAQTLELGFETNKAGGDGKKQTDVTTEMDNIHFNNIDIIHALHKAPISIHNGDRCHIGGKISPNIYAPGYSISFRNIIVEDYRLSWNYIVDFANINGGEGGQFDVPFWSTNNGDRSIKNVLVDNIYILKGYSPSARFQNGSRGNYQPANNGQNVIGEYNAVFENVRIKNTFYEGNFFRPGITYAGGVDWEHNGIYTPPEQLKAPDGTTLSECDGSCLDYSTDNDIIVDSLTTDNYTINLSRETCDTGGLKVSGWSANGKVGSGVFDQAALEKALNKDLDLVLTVNGETVKFPTIKKRPGAPKFKVNYELAKNNGLYGQWQLRPAKGGITEEEYKAVQIARTVVLSNGKDGKVPDVKGWGKFEDIFSGVCVQPLPANGKPGKLTYLFRNDATFNNNVYTAASKTKKIKATTQEKKLKLQIQNGKINIKANTYVNGALANNGNKGTVPALPGFIVRSGATIKKAAGADLILS